MVHRLAAAARPCFTPTVIGAPIAAAPFGDVDFRAVARPMVSFNRTRGYAAGVARMLRRDIRPALVEVHNRPEIAMYIAASCPSSPVVLVLHNDPQGMRGARSSAQRATLLRRLAEVVTVSAYLRDRLLMDVGAPANSPVVIANAIDLAELPDPLPASEREKLIVFAGRVVADKGADVFVAAARLALPRLPGWRAVIVGADRFRADAPETAFMRTLRPAAREAGVKLLGYRPHADVQALLARAAIAAVPSRWDEPFGLAALEAMAAGAALICAEAGALREVAGAAARYIPRNDSVALAQAMIHLAGDEGARSLLAAAGRERARRFDIAVVGAAYDALRTRLLAATRGV
jgi:glycosyltransferase involved in cell wall biosynthesis